MLIFNCTKAAADFFTSIRKGKKTSPMSPTPKLALTEEFILHDHQHWHWMVHVTKLGRTNVLSNGFRFTFLHAFLGAKKRKYRTVPRTIS